MDLRDLAQDAEKMSSDAASTPESSVNEEVAGGVTVELTGYSENAETTTGDVAGEAKEYTKETVIERLVTISESDGSEISRDEVSKLKQVFYNIRKNELLAEKQAFVDQGNEESAFAPMPDSMEQQMYELLNIIKNKKAQYIVRLESEREQNLQKKQAVIAELNSMAERNSRLVAVEDRPVETKDTVVMDFEGFVEGKAFEGGKAEKYELEIGSNTFIPGFEDQVIGIKIGEEKDINVTFPEEYFSKDLAGKPAIFKVKLHEIKAKELPKMDDEFAKDVSEFDTIAELKADIKKNLEHQNKHRAEHEMEDAAIEKVCKNAKIDIPSGMIENEIDAMEDDLNRRLTYQGVNLEQYLKMMNKTREAFRDEMKLQAEISIKTRLVLEAICKDAKIKVTDKELNEKIAELAKTYGRSEDDLKQNEEFKKYVSSSIESEKTVKFILDNAVTK